VSEKHWVNNFVVHYKWLVFLGNLSSWTSLLNPAKKKDKSIHRSETSKTCLLGFYEHNLFSQMHKLIVNSPRNDKIYNRATVLKTVIKPHKNLITLCPQKNRSFKCLLCISVFVLIFHTYTSFGIIIIGICTWLFCTSVTVKKYFGLNK